MFLKDIPGSTFQDTDPEVARNYFGTLPGTISIRGYGLEYRQSQRMAAPNIPPQLETAVTLPVMPAKTTIDQRFNTLRGQHWLSTERELYERLRELLGPER